jgi:hypothetical protein
VLDYSLADPRIHYGVVVIIHVLEQAFLIQNVNSNCGIHLSVAYTDVVKILHQNTVFMDFYKTLFQEIAAYFPIVKCGADFTCAS